MPDRSFKVYKSKDEILLAKVILEPQHSILTQSYDSRLRMVGPPRLPQQHLTLNSIGLANTPHRTIADPTMVTASV